MATSLSSTSKRGQDLSTGQQPVGGSIADPFGIQQTLPTELLEKVITIFWLSSLTNSTRVTFLTSAPLVSSIFAAVSSLVVSRDVFIPSAPYAQKFINNVMTESERTLTYPCSRASHNVSRSYKLGSSSTTKGSVRCFELHDMFAQLRSLTFQIESSTRSAPSVVSTGDTPAHSDIQAYIEGPEAGVNGILQSQTQSFINAVADTTLEPPVGAAMFDVLFYLHGIPERLPRLRTVTIIYAGCSPSLAFADLFDGLRLLNFPPQVSKLRICYEFTQKHVHRMEHSVLHNLHLGAAGQIHTTYAPWPHVPPHQLIAGQISVHPPQVPPSPHNQPLGLWTLPGIKCLEVCGAGASSVAAELVATCPRLETLMVDIGTYLPRLVPLPASTQMIVLRSVDRRSHGCLGTRGATAGSARTTIGREDKNILLNENMRQALEESGILTAMERGLFPRNDGQTRQLLVEMDEFDKGVMEFVTRIAKACEIKDVHIFYRGLIE